MPLLPIGSKFKDKDIGWFEVIGYYTNSYGSKVEDVLPCDPPVKAEKAEAKGKAVKTVAVKCSTKAPEPAWYDSVEPFTFHDAVVLGKTAAAIATGVAFGPLAGIAAFVGLAATEPVEKPKKAARKR
jgi:hypothetical protein